MRWEQRTWAELPHDLAAAGNAAILPSVRPNSMVRIWAAAWTAFWPTGFARRWRRTSGCRCFRPCPMAVRSGIAGAGPAPSRCTDDAH